MHTHTASKIKNVFHDPGNEGWECEKFGKNWAYDGEIDVWSVSEGQKMQCGHVRSVFWEIQNVADVTGWDGLDMWNIRVKMIECLPVEVWTLEVVEIKGRGKDLGSDGVC